MDDDVLLVAVTLVDVGHALHGRGAEPWPDPLVLPTGPPSLMGQEAATAVEVVTVAEAAAVVTEGSKRQAPFSHIR